MTVQTAVEKRSLLYENNQQASLSPSSKKLKRTTQIIRTPWEELSSRYTLLNPNQCKIDSHTILSRTQTPHTFHLMAQKSGSVSIQFQVSTNSRPVLLHCDPDVMLVLQKRFATHWNSTTSFCQVLDWILEAIEWQRRTADDYSFDDYGSYWGTFPEICRSDAMDLED